MAAMRRWIANPQSYDGELRDILAKRNKSADLISPEEYQKIEIVDRFAALLVRLIDHNPEQLEEDRRWLVEQSFDRYWIHTIYSTRPELKTYLRDHWERVMREIEKYREARNSRPATSAM